MRWSMVPTNYLYWSAESLLPGDSYTWYKLFIGTGSSAIALPIITPLETSIWSAEVIVQVLGHSEQSYVWRKKAAEVSLSLIGT